MAGDLRAPPQTSQEVSYDQEYPLRLDLQVRQGREPVFHWPREGRGIHRVTFRVQVAQAFPHGGVLHGVQAIQKEKLSACLGAPSEISARILSTSLESCCLAPALEGDWRLRAA